MRLSQSGYAALCREEGLRLEAYPDPATGGDPWTIGIGCTTYRDGSPVKKGDVLSLGEAHSLAQWHIEQIEAQLASLVTVPLTAGQWDAIVSLTFNIGISAFEHSTLLKKLNAGDYTGAAAEFDRWVYAAGKIMQGLVNRRQKERAMFLSEMPEEIVAAPPPPPDLQPPAPIRESVPPIYPPSEPSEESQAMPIPALAWAAAQTLLPVVADLFRGHGGSTATRNADIIEKAGPTLVEIAKTVTGTQTAEEAIGKIQTDPSMRDSYRRAVEVDIDKLVGMIERVTAIDDASRDKAAVRAKGEAKDLAPRMADQQFWIAVAVGVVIAVIAIIDVWKDGVMSEGVMALVVGYATWAMNKRGTIVDYRFGSSSGSQAKNEIIAASRK